MRAVLLTLCSVPILSDAVVPGSSHVSLSRHAFGVFSRERSSFGSPMISLRFDTNHRREASSGKGIGRELSESDVVRSKTGGKGLRGLGSQSFPARIPEEGSDSESEEDGISLPSKGAGIWPECWIPPEELEFFGEEGKQDFGDHRNGNNEDRSKIGEYYQEMLKSYPGESLLLGNYGKFLHQVENDLVRAEEYYSRALLADPGDGELLSFYGKLIWESQRDGERAESYYERAVHASPDNCTVLGSYAHFLWELEEEDEDEKEESKDIAGGSPALVTAFWLEALLKILTVVRFV